MPWTGQSFQERHNHSLGPARAAHAARIANAVLRGGTPEGESIAIANKWAARHRDAGGGVDPTQGGVGGPTPSAQTMNPLTQSLIQRYSSLPPEKLQELAARVGGTPQGQMIRQILQRRLMQPNAQPMGQAQGAMPPQSVGNLNPAAAGQAGLQMMQGARRGGEIRRDYGGAMPPPPVMGGPPPRPTMQSGPASGPPMIPQSPAAIAGRPPIPPQAPAVHPSGVGQPNPLTPLTPQQQTPQQTNAGIWNLIRNAGYTPPAQARGGSIPHRDMGGMMGVPMSAASPWWTRSEARSEDQSGGGFLAGTTGGRADAISTTAPAGSHVLPADVVAGLGDGNSLAGARVWDEILRSGPHGIPSTHGGRGMGPPRAPAPLRGAMAGWAKGGGVGKPQPVRLSHGEVVTKPEDVIRIGGGDRQRGHEAIDHFIMEVRKRYTQKLRGLPPPVGMKRNAA